jgi:hypothetical protein
MYRRDSLDLTNPEVDFTRYFEVGRQTYTHTFRLDGAKAKKVDTEEDWRLYISDIMAFESFRMKNSDTPNPLVARDKANRQVSEFR